MIENIDMKRLALYCSFHNVLGRTTGHCVPPLARDCGDGAMVRGALSGHLHGAVAGE